MSHSITYRYRVQVDCNIVQAGRIAKLLPGGALERTAWPRDPERAALAAVLVVRDFLKQVAEESKC